MLLSACNKKEEKSESTPSGQSESTPSGQSESTPATSESTPGTSESTSGGEESHPFDVDLGPAPTYEEDSVQFHYYRKDGKYTGWDMWLWEKGFDGGAFAFNGQDEWGVIASYPLSKWKDPINNSLGFLIRKGNWEAKDLGGDDLYLDFSGFVKDDNGVYHAYLISGEPNIYTNKEGDMKGVILGANFITKTSIYVNCNMKMKRYELYEGSNETPIATKDLNSPYTYISLPSGKTPRFDLEYRVKVEFINGDVKEANVSKTILYDDAEFCAEYNYEGNDLGATYTESATTFKVWSPASSSIKVRIYENDSPVDNEIYEEYDMVAGEKGVFSYTANANYAGAYYTYVVNNGTYKDKEIVDPYAKSAGCNGQRGMIVDFARTNPDGWEGVSPLQIDRKNLVVYETHVADVTSSTTWTGTEANRKLFKGMYESGTKYQGVTTGFDHIKELGVNAVQIIPLFDQANDEENMTFNWGYNPLNYNVVEGGYSSNPHDGYARIREFKQLVKEYHDAGMNIIMDVVYNHVNSAAGSNFDVLMPGYYYRYNSNGTLSNGSGCGNETASNHYMMRKFMIDSAKFWAEEYKLGGFRFDLMGLHDIETMNQLTAAVQRINPKIAVYGEPWTGGDTPLKSELQAKQANANSFEGYGQFNDQTRDALIKGGLSGKTERGWITNKDAINNSDLNKIVGGLKGQTLGSAVIKDPNKTVNYVTCHDNYTLYDRAIATKKFTEADDAELAKMNVLANSVIFASQGISFMLAGEEFLRTKGGNENSYNASYEVNELDYALKVKHLDMVESYKKLIALKTKGAEFAYEQSDIESKVTVDASNDYIKLTISGSTSYVFFFKNGYGSESTVSVPNGYSLYWSTIDGNTKTMGSSVTLKNYETLVLRK